MEGVDVADDGMVSEFVDGPTIFSILGAVEDHAHQL
jgi:hypothetical protein